MLYVIDDDVTIMMDIIIILWPSSRSHQVSVGQKELEVLLYFSFVGW